MTMSAHRTVNHWPDREFGDRVASADPQAQDERVFALSLPPTWG
jgi:hypothetical protein